MLAHARGSNASQTKPWNSVRAERGRRVVCPARILKDMRLTAAIAHEDDWYAARCLEVDVTSQGRTIDEARTNLEEALALYFEDQPLDHAPEPLIITPVDIPT